MDRKRVRKYDSLSYIVDTLLLVEKGRIALQTRINHLAKQGRTDSEAVELKKKTQELEDFLTEKLSYHIKNHPAYPWFSRVKGVGPENIAKVVAFIDIEKARYVSSLWKWFGFTPNSKREKGKKLEFNFRAKTMAYRLGLSLFKAKGKFYDYYLNEKRKFEMKCRKNGLTIKPQAKIRKKDTNVISEGHVHAYATRKMLKLFLACLFLSWKENLDLPVPEPYVVAKMGHKSLIKPEEMIDQPKGRKKTTKGKRAKQLKKTSWIK